MQNYNIQSLHSLLLHEGTCKRNTEDVRVGTAVWRYEFLMFFFSVCVSTQAFKCPQIWTLCGFYFSRYQKRDEVRTQMQ